MNRYAVIEGADVVNVVLWDGETEFTPDAGQLRECPDEVGPGWQWIDGEWIAPPVVIEEEPEDPELDRKNAARAELVSKGFSEDTARVMVGLPPAE